MSLRRKIAVLLTLITAVFIALFLLYAWTVLKSQVESPDMILIFQGLRQPLIFGIVGLAVFVLWTLDKLTQTHVIRRLTQMGEMLQGIHDVRAIEPFGFHKRYPDEISDMADEIAAMLQRLRDSQAKYQASESKFRALFDAMPQAMVLREYIFDSDGVPVDYRTTDMSPAYAELLGVDREASVGKLRSEVFAHFGTEDWVMPLLPEILAGKPQSLFRYSSLLGKHMQVWVYRFGENNVAVSFTDVTESVEQNLQLETHNRSLRDLLMATEQLLDIPLAGMDYDTIAAQTRHLFGAEAVIFSLAREDIMRLETVAISASSEAMAQAESFLKLHLAGSTWDWHLDKGDLSSARALSYDRLADLLHGQIDETRADQLQELLGLDSFHLLELSHRSLPLGNLLICLKADAVPITQEVLLVYTRILSAVLLRGQAEVAVQDSETRYRALIDAAPVAILVTDLQGDILIANEQAAWLHGYASGETMVGLNTMVLVHEDDREVVRRHMVERLDGRVQRNLERKLRRVDGLHFHAEVTARAILTAGGQPVGQLIIFQDITDRKAAEEKLVFLSMHDQLTGLYNRAYFEEELSRLQSGRQFPVSIIMADVNGLKIVNDSFGHRTGDQLLKVAAGVLQKALRRSDTLARVGGDEFALALPKADAAVAATVMSRIRQAVEEYNSLATASSERDVGWVPFSLSLGSASANHPQTRLEDLFSLADGEMYKDKQAQGDNYKDLLADALRSGTLFPRENVRGHVQGLQDMAYAMAEKLNLDEPTRMRLHLLAQAHDFGYISIPLHIVEKPGPLTEAEWQHIKEHPQQGAQVARKSEEFAPVAPLILCHHENWDGSGYPKGLRGEEIPLECRIFSLADTFDILTKGEAYQEAVSAEEALAEIGRGAGTQFDPSLAAIFIEMMKDRGGR